MNERRNSEVISLNTDGQNQTGKWVTKMVDLTNIKRIKATTTTLTTTTTTTTTTATTVLRGIVETDRQAGRQTETGSEREGGMRT